MSKTPDATIEEPAPAAEPIAPAPDASAEGAPPPEPEDEDDLDFEGLAPDLVSGLPGDTPADEEEEEDETPPPAEAAPPVETPAPAAEPNEDPEETPEEQLARLQRENPELFEKPYVPAEGEDDIEHVHSEFGQIDPDRLEARATARQAERLAIINEIRRDVPDCPESELASILAGLAQPVEFPPTRDKPQGEKRPYTVYELQHLRKTGQLKALVKVGIQQAIAEGKLKPSKSEERPPIPKGTPPNPDATPKPVLSAADEAAIDAMLEASPELDRKSLTASYLKRKGK